MTMATFGLVVGSIFAHADLARCCSRPTRSANLVRAALVLLWAQMNYEQLTSLFRVEERSVSYVAATLANVIITVVATILLVAVWHKGAIGVIVGNFTGTLAVYFVLLGYRRFQLGLEFDRGLFRQMQRFGLPLVPSGLALWVIDLSDRFFLVHMKGLAETGLYSVGVRISTAILLRADRAADGLAGLRLLDQGRRRGQAHVRVRAHLRALRLLLALAGALAARAVARAPADDAEVLRAAAEVVPLLVFGGTAFIAFNVMSIGIGRAKKTQFNWVVTGGGGARQHRAQLRR